MVSVKKSNRTTGFRLRRKGRRGSCDEESVGLVVAGLCFGVFLAFLYSVAFSDSTAEEGRKVPLALRKKLKHPKLMDTEADDGNVGGNGGAVDSKGQLQRPHKKRVRPMGDGMNAIALDILNTLNCAKLFEELEDKAKMFGNNYVGMDDHYLRAEDPIHRRLQQEHEDGEEGSGDVPKKEDQIPGLKGDNHNPALDDDRYAQEFDDFEGDFPEYGSISATHLFCMAASEIEKTPENLKKNIKCDGAGEKRKSLLGLWSSARSQIGDVNLLKKVLDLATETSVNIMGKPYRIWYPYLDHGTTFLISALNSEKNADNGGLLGLEDVLGPGKTFVDVGSCLGLTCLAINQKYPGTKIVSVEPASPNWLLQEITLRCNLSHNELKNTSIILAGVGSNTDEEDSMMAKFMWRPTSISSARSWTPADEYQAEDVELVVKLRKLKSILAEADVEHTKHIDVLNLDCQGCEYNMVPALTREEFDEIPTVMGNIHWGYITPEKLPSSARGKTTHERLCQHENFARDKKECCAFPDVPVRSSVPGEVLQKDSKEFPFKEITVSDVIDDGMCDDFPAWSDKHFLNDINDDFNWSELSSQA